MLATVSNVAELQQQRSTQAVVMCQQEWRCPKSHMQQQQQQQQSVFIEWLCCTLISLTPAHSINSSKLPVKLD
jgi:hypothetical protein